MLVRNDGRQTSRQARRTGTPRPIVSLSVGDSAEFGFKADYLRESYETVTLESGALPACTSLFFTLSNGPGNI